MNLWIANKIDYLFNWLEMKFKLFKNLYFILDVEMH